MGLAVAGAHVPSASFETQSNYFENCYARAALPGAEGTAKTIDEMRAEQILVVGLGFSGTQTELQTAALRRLNHQIVYPYNPRFAEMSRDAARQRGDHGRAENIQREIDFNNAQKAAVASRAPLPIVISCLADIQRSLTAARSGTPTVFEPIRLGTARWDQATGRYSLD